MNKGELIDKIAAETGLKKADATAALNATLGSIKDALKTGQKVTVVGFGSFDVGYRAARTGVNPSDTKKKIQIPAKATVRFKAGKELTASVDNKALRTQLQKEADEKAKKKKK